MQSWQEPRNRERIYHDPLHGAIVLNGRDPAEALLIHLIDTPAFQRLRRIRQLGPASLTFHGAETSRFTHSLGVLEIARRAFDRVAKDYAQLQSYRVVVLCAALLHDIGHGPFSHTCEEIFGCDHEHWTKRILIESEPIRECLDRFDPDLLPQIQQVHRKQHPVPLVWQLVTSQLDCDRIDYLMRDSYFSGASYGRLDLDRILLALRFEPVTQQMVVAQKGMAAIEHYLLVRHFMYAQVYNHSKNLAATWILSGAFRRAKELLPQGKLWADPNMAAWLSEDCNEISLQQYLAADDGVFLYHLQQWQSADDPLLADLCRRFVDRDLLKAWDISRLGDSKQQALLQEARQKLDYLGFAPDYYVGICKTVSRGYTLYQKGINLLTDSGLQEISERSPLVRTLTQPWQRSWLLYPRQLNVGELVQSVSS